MATLPVMSVRAIPLRKQKQYREEMVMTTRRDFLKGSAAAATGIVFCSCGLLKSAHGQEAARQKLPVMVGGKRVKTIDVHAHCHFHEAGALLGEEAGFEGRRHRRQRGRPGILRSEIPSRMGQGGRTRRAPIHSSAGLARTQ